MDRFLERALDLDRLGLFDEGVRLGFERPLPAWAWVMIVVGAICIGVFSYRRMLGPIAVRSVLRPRCQSGQLEGPRSPSPGLAFQLSSTSDRAANESCSHSRSSTAVGGTGLRTSSRACR